MIRKCTVLLAFSLVLLVQATAGVAQDDVGDLFGRVNNLRASLGLHAYTINAALAAAAQQQAQWIAETGNVSHTRPDGSGPRTRALNNGYPSTDVSENIYGGNRATADVAWSFWVNSGIHYAGLTHRSYQEVGIGVARTDWGAAYVMVFGNPGGPAPFVPSNSEGTGGSIEVASAGGAAAPPAPPSYVVGSDAFGNIMHRVQPGDTIGDIALIYGYTWDDIPYMLQLNGLADVRDLEVDSIFLVPPHGGTHTPTPGGESEPTATPDAPEASTATPTLEPTPGFEVTIVPRGIATAASVPEELLVELASEATAEATDEPVAAPLVVAAPTDANMTPGAPMTAGVTVVRSNNSTWLFVAIAVQVVIVLGAAFEFIRRSRRK